MNSLLQVGPKGRVPLPPDPPELIRDRLLAIGAAAIAQRLDARRRLVRHDVEVRRYVLFRGERYDIGQASPLYWMLLQMRGDPAAESHLTTGLRQLEAHRPPPDHNAGFRALFLLAYWHGWGSTLAPATQSLLISAVHTAIATCRRRAAHNRAIEPAYTNFWMIETTVYCLGGALLRDAALTRRGERMAHAFAQYLTRLDAMDEFSSPSYVVVDLVAAGILRRGTGSRQLRATAQQFERHFLRHLGRHCDSRSRRWFGPYSRAYDVDLAQSGSLQNLLLYRLTGDRGWLRGPFDTRGAWAVVLALLDLPAFAPPPPRPGLQIRETALAHPQSPYEQRRCVLTVYHGRRFRLTSADAYREWEQTYPVTVHCGEVTVAGKSLVMGHFQAAQQRGLALVFARPVCTLGGAGRDDMLQDTVRRVGYEWQCLTGRHQARVVQRAFDGRIWTCMRIGTVTINVCPLMLGPEMRYRCRAAGETLRLSWSRTWRRPQVADVAFLAQHGCAFCLWVSESRDRADADLSASALPRVAVMPRGDAQCELRARVANLAVRLPVATRALRAAYWSSSGWACRTVE